MRCAFVHIPKTGGGSVVEWAKRNNVWDQFIFYGHKDIDYIKNLDDTFDASFCIVRNTYSRLVSAYVFSEAKFRKNITKGYQLEWMTNLLLAWEKGIVPWLELMHETQHVTCRDQLDFSQGVDFIIQTSDLYKSTKLHEMFNITDPIRKERRVQMFNPSLYYTTDFINCVNRLYKDEIAYFNYQPDI